MDFCFNHQWTSFNENLTAVDEMFSVTNRDIVDAINDKDLRSYLSGRKFTYVKLNMERLEHIHLPSDICTGIYGSRNFLSIKILRYSHRHEKWTNDVIFIFQRYVNSGIIVSNGLPVICVNNSEPDAAILRALLIGSGINNDYMVKKYNSPMLLNNSFHDIIINGS